MRTDLKVEDLQLSEDLKTLPMIAMYDEALKTLLSQVFAGKVILAPVSRAFELFTKQIDESIKFPFISLFPVEGYKEVNQNYSATNIGIPALRQARVYNDNTLKYEGQSSVMQNFYQMLYFDIPYSISCWSNNRIQALQLVQELMFWLKAQREVKVKYKDQIYRANVTINDTIIDGSLYETYGDQGAIYRFDISLIIEGPVYRTQNYLNVTNVSMELELKEGDN